MVETGSERNRIFAAESFQLFRITENIPSQGMPPKYQILEIIENKFGRVVLIRLYFIYYDFRLFLNLPLRKSGMEYNIRQQFKGAAKNVRSEKRNR